MKFMELLVEQDNHLTTGMIIRFINQIYNNEILPDDYECDRDSGSLTFNLPEEDFRYSLDFYFNVDIEVAPRVDRHGDVVDAGEFSFIPDYILLTDNRTEQNLRVPDKTNFLDVHYIYIWCQDKLYDWVFGDWDYDF